MPFQFGTSKFIVTVTITVAVTGVQNFFFFKSWLKFEEFFVDILKKEIGKAYIAI